MQMLAIKLCNISNTVQSVQVKKLLIRYLHVSDVLHCRASVLFQPVTVGPPGSKTKLDTLSNSQKLMLENGIIRNASPGMYHLLPLATKSLNKLIHLVDEEMRQQLHCQKLELSHLISKNLMEETGRWSELQSELYKLQDRHDREFCLGPTFEEAVTDLIRNGPKISNRQLPLRLYQITKKYRDEPRAKFGLLRAKEFIMKDMYSFDKDESLAKVTYEQVCLSYENIFSKLGLNIIKVRASTGSIGGQMSHEYHLQSEIGEDQFKLCPKCKQGFNTELCDEDVLCRTCQSKLECGTGIEVGHAFLLGTRYSKPLNATYISEPGTESHYHMGCYGIGITRLLAAGIEVLSTGDEIRWPKHTAPYQICIIPPKKGSKEEAATSMSTHLYEMMKCDLTADVLYDDRSHMTIGERLRFARKTGYPYIIVVGKKALESRPQFELHDVYSKTVQYLTHAELLHYIKKACTKVLSY